MAALPSLSKGCNVAPMGICVPALDETSQCLVCDPWFVIRSNRVAGRFLPPLAHHCSYYSQSSRERILAPAHHIPYSYTHGSGTVFTVKILHPARPPGRVTEACLTQLRVIPMVGSSLVPPDLCQLHCLASPQGKGWALS